MKIVDLTMPIPENATEVLPYTKLSEIKNNPKAMDIFDQSFHNQRTHVLCKNTDDSREHYSLLLKDSVTAHYGKDEYEKFKEEQLYDFCMRLAISDTANNEGVSLDRTSPQYGYFKGNTRWTNMVSQSRNKWSSVVFYIIDVYSNFGYMYNSIISCSEDFNIPDSIIKVCLAKGTMYKTKSGRLYRFVRLQNEKIMTDYGYGYCYMPVHNALFKNQNISNQCW